MRIVECIVLLAGVLAGAPCLVWAGGQHPVWQVGEVVLEPGPPGSFDSVAVKDPSIVQFGGRWHLFYTARSQADYTLGYTTAEQLADLRTAKRFRLSQLRGIHNSYAAAPQVFFFRPQDKWYLIYQSADAGYQPMYSTSSDLGDPHGWSAGRPLVTRTDTASWIDFWVICDDQNAYLFFTRNHREVVVMSTRLEDFPSGFGEPRTVFGPVYEAVHVYAVQGGRRPQYVMFYEQRDQYDIRHFGLARAPTLLGGWRTVDDSFACAERLTQTSGARWTDEVSHGEFLRSGYDQWLEIPRGHWDFLIQGMPRSAHEGSYGMLTWRLGLIRERFH